MQVLLCSALNSQYASFSFQANSIGNSKIDEEGNIDLHIFEEHTYNLLNLAVAFINHRKWSKKLRKHFEGERLRVHSI